MQMKYSLFLDGHYNRLVNKRKNILISILSTIYKTASFFKILNTGFKLEKNLKFYSTYFSTNNLLKILHLT